jgi:hypothetical protein
VKGSCEHGNEPSGSIKCWERYVALLPKYLNFFITLRIY